MPATEYDINKLLFLLYMNLLDFKYKKINFNMYYNYNSKKM